jgi:signal transduction histidine kinase
VGAKRDCCPEREQIENVRMTIEQNALPRALSLAVHELRTPMTVVAGYLRMLVQPAYRHHRRDERARKARR